MTYTGLCHASRRSIRVAPPEAETEREADLMADTVMSGGQVTAPQTGTPAGMLHRQCATCVAGGPPCASCAEENVLQLDRASGGAAPPRFAPASVASAVSGGGQRLPDTLRSYFEPRFGADLSGVRLHTGARAGQAAKSVGARAFTLGQNIAFASGAYRPETRDGQRLVAHEIAHTLQDAPDLLQREDEAEEPLNLDTTGGGNTEIRDTVEGDLETEGNVTRGHVRRIETAPATETERQEVISNELTNLEFRRDTCELVLPYRFGFRLRENSDTPEYCKGERMDGTPDVDQIASDYVDAVNDGLNDQFTVRLSGCEEDCADRDIPIRIEATRDDNNAEQMVDVIPRSGRGSTGDICAGEGLDTSFVRHEAGHTVLGRGDEYPETDPGILARNPQWGRPERVRRDYNTMGSRRRYGRFAVFHRRDFQHVIPFMRQVFPDCSVELQGVPQVNVSFRLRGTVGGGVVSGAGAVRLGASLGVGVPLTRGREWLFVAEAHGDYLAQLGETQRQFVLAGIRAGVEYRLGGSGPVSGRLYGGAGFGVSHELERRDFRASTTHPARTSAFGEGILGGGIMLHGQAGRAMTVDLQLSGGGEMSGSNDDARWFTVGFNLGGRF